MVGTKNSTYFGYFSCLRIGINPMGIKIIKIGINAHPNNLIPLKKFGPYETVVVLSIV